MVEDNSHAGQGPVVLDIGGDVGALVVAMPAGLTGSEIEARPVAGPALLDAYTMAGTATNPVIVTATVRWCTSGYWSVVATARCTTPRCSANCPTAATSCTSGRTVRCSSPRPSGAAR